MQEIILPADETAKKLANYLKKRFPIGYVRKLFRKNAIRRNGQKAKPDDLLRQGDRIQIYIPFEKQAEKSGERLFLGFNCPSCLKITSCSSSTSLRASRFMKRKRFQSEKPFWASWKTNIEAKGSNHDWFIASIKIPRARSWFRKRKNPLRSWKICLRRAKSKKNIFA